MRNEIFQLGIIRATEAGAISAYQFMGKGDENGADQVAVNTIREYLNKIDMEGVVVIGEGERDNAPMLYIGEEIGTGHGPKVDIAVDPLEGTNIVATGGPHSLSIIAITNKGNFLHAPDVYMKKIAIGFNHSEQIIDLNISPIENLKNIALAKKCSISDLVVVILDRPRHKDLIAEVRAAGSRIQLIKDGDVAAIIATTMPHSGIDAYMGIGGAPEGVLAAAALCTTGGQMCGQLIIDKDEDKKRAKRMGIQDFNKQYYLSDLASGDVIFAATGVTDGSIVKGVRITPANIITQSILMNAYNKTIRTIETKYQREVR